MSTFICEKCGCVDNTACGGTYWSTIGDMKYFKDEYYNEYLVCVACAPLEYEDGSKNRRAGKWHDYFEKKHWSEIGTVEDILKLEEKHDGSMINATEYFKRRGMIAKKKGKITVISEKEPSDFTSAAKSW